MKIENKIIKSEPVSWKTFKFIQDKDFKELTKEAYGKLKQSLINNNFVESFKVWQNGDLYCLDGYHRCKALTELENEGYMIPDTFNADFLDCKDKKEASKLVLIYSSIYAKVTDEGLYEFINANDLNFDDLKLEIDIPDIDAERFELNFYKEQDEEKLDAVPDIPKEAVSKTGDIFLIDGKHRVMCGDSTLKVDVEALMAGKKADMVFTDPPYGMMLDADFSDMKGLGCGNKYKNVQGDREDFSPELINTVFRHFDNAKEIFLWGADYYAELIPERNKGCFMVWDKMQGGEGVNDKYDKMFGSNFELVWSKRKHKRAIARVLWKGFFGLSGEDGKKRLHPTQKPTKLVIWFLEKFSFEQKEIIADLFLGSGSTLIACEQTNRICYGMEIDPIYIDVILNRYKNLYPEAKFECLNREFDFTKLWMN